MKLCIFEDQLYRNLLPLVWLRPVYFLRCGITDLAEKIKTEYSDLDVVYHCRDYLADTVRESEAAVNTFDDDTYVFINGRVLFHKKVASCIARDKIDIIYNTDTTDIAAVLSPERVKKVKAYAGKPLELRKLFPGLPVEHIESEVITCPWDLVNKNPELLLSDFSRLFPKPKIKGTVYDGANIIGEKNIQVGEHAVIKPGVVLDAENGPVCIGSGATIMANAVIEGPAYIGRETLIKAGAKIYRGTSIGELNKIGGEVTASIIHSHSNKQHDGFLGHSYLCQWVNLGANTNNSNLKNNYRNVTVTIDGVPTDTGSLFVGLFMGDHSKSGINTMFNTGTVVGIHCNIFGEGFPPKYIPSFSWGGTGGFEEYKLEKALDTAQYVVSRKKMELSVAFNRLFSYIFGITAEERAKFFRSENN